jgi:transcriptional regulator with XRE-family HTH domain
MPRKDDLRQVFNQRLAQARAGAGLSQKQLGIQAGLDSFVASARINRYELGIHQPDLPTVERLAKALNVPTAYLFAQDERLARLILAFDQLSEAEKTRLLNSLEKP